MEIINTEESWGFFVDIENYLYDTEFDDTECSDVFYENQYFSENAHNYTNEYIGVMNETTRNYEANNEYNSEYNNEYNSEYNNILQKWSVSLCILFCILLIFVI
jgi:hypothetical protein